MENYFQILKSSQGTSSNGDEPVQTYLADTSHKAFTKGHFPNKPILPAYALSVLASECLSQYLDLGPGSAHPLENYKIHSSKFVSPATPKEKLVVVINVRSNSKIEVKISQNDQVCSSIIYQQKNL